MQLKRYLALHEKKKQKDLKNLKSQVSIRTIPKRNVSGSMVRKGIPPHIASPSREKVLAQPATSEKVVDSPLPGRASSSSKAEAEEEERKKKHADAEKKMDDLTKKRKAIKESEEWEQQRVTALTDQLTDCVSEIAEHERNMERVHSQLALLQKELEVIVCV